MHSLLNQYDSETEDEDEAVPFFDQPLASHYDETELEGPPPLPPLSSIVLSLQSLSPSPLEQVHENIELEHLEQQQEEDQDHQQQDQNQRLESVELEIEDRLQANQRTKIRDERKLKRLQSILQEKNS